MIAGTWHRLGAAALVFVGAAGLGASVGSGCSGTLGDPSDGPDPKVTCSAPSERCGTACVDTRSDASHCGMCGHTCSPGQVCSNGACASSCAPATTECSRGCVDLTTDVRNCGACGRACGQGEQCSQGVCCAAGQEVCNGLCADTKHDRSNCGTCGVQCSGDTLCLTGQCAVPATCQAVAAGGASMADGVVTVDPDGAGGAAPFQVFCDMTSFGGGFTLVGQEQAGAGQNLRYLGIETGQAADLLTNGNALIGVRFAGLYQEVLITWEDGAKHLRFKPEGELFANTDQRSLSVHGFESNDTDLASWVAADGGAIFCRAATSPDIRPGDTSWAVKPMKDQNTGCGCNSSGWVGRGAYYTGSSDCTVCGCWGPGSFVGAKDDGQQKAGMTSYKTRIFVR